MTPGNLIIRPATLSDVAALHAVIQRAYRGPMAATSWSHQGELPTNERISQDALAELVTDPEVRFSAATLEGRVVGSSLVQRASAHACLIGLLSTDPDVQGRGVGDRLLRQAEVDARSAFSVERIRLEVLGHKARLIAYYERRGYRRTELTRPYAHLSTPAHFVILTKELKREP